MSFGTSLLIKAVSVIGGVFVAWLMEKIFIKLYVAMKQRAALKEYHNE